MGVNRNLVLETKLKPMLGMRRGRILPVRGDTGINIQRCCYLTLQHRNRSDPPRG